MSKLFLLSLEEAKKIPQDILIVENSWWWLRSPGYVTYTAVIVIYDGRVGEYGRHVSHVGISVRPALYLKTQISNFSSTKKGYIKLGTQENGKPIEWIDISDYIGKPCLLMKNPYEYHRFDAESNKYETSEIKARLNELDNIIFTDAEREMIEDWEGFYDKENKILQSIVN